MVNSKLLIQKMLRESLSEDDYRGSHTAPNRGETNSPMDALENTFGDDVYGPNCARYYGHGGGLDAEDKFSCAVIRSAKGQPNKKIKIYRAVPKDVTTINVGDWVTINPKYARQHGKSHLQGYKILSMVALAKDLYSDGNSIHEWGYNPEPASEVNEAVLDEDYPTNFDMAHFKTLKSFEERVQYCDENLKRVSGQGSSRIVYKVDNEKVLKLAKNEAGIAQNKTEIKWGKNPNYTQILAHTFDSHPKGLWVEMELARPVTEENFEMLMGYKLEQLCLFLKWYYFTTKGNQPKAELYKRILMNAEDENPMSIEDFKKSPFAGLVIKFMTAVKTGSGDFCMYDTYGLVKRNGKNQVVIIDFGITEEIYRSYYS